MNDATSAEWPDASIVVIDDDTILCRVLEQVLGVHGYEGVHTFSDPVEAVERYGELEPDLVLTDDLRLRYANARAETLLGDEGGRSARRDP